MKRFQAASSLSILITIGLPFLLVGNAVLLLFQPWIVGAEYALPGFPDDPLGLAGKERTELGEVGVRSVTPFGPGVEVLREARLPDGQPAFQEREITHMQDVRDLVRLITVLWAVALVGMALAAMGLRHAGQPERIRSALGRGAVITLAAMVLLGLLMLVAFDFFFDGFHSLFFEPGTWSFKDHFTLRRLYPDAFWTIASGAMAGLVLIQAAAIAYWARSNR